MDSVVPGERGGCWLQSRAVQVSLLPQIPLLCSEHEDAAERTFTSRLWLLTSRR